MKILKKNSELKLVLIVCFLVFSSELFGQGKIITGVVNSDNNQPIPGVNIIQKGTSNGVGSDFNGNFTITLLDNQSNTLIFSSIGFQTVEEIVDDRTIINVTMFESIESLDNVVVIGYGTQKKTNLTSAMSYMDAEGLDERPLNRLDQVLVGQLSGVRVAQTSGIPGAGFNIQVRGSGSIGLNTNPLYVIDGFPLDTDGEPSNLNPNDIESIQVLKDAAASSIYGSRGANGVILITTKKGKSGKAQFSFNTYTGWGETSKKLDLLSAEEWVERAKEHIDFSYIQRYGDIGASVNHTTAERQALIGTSNVDVRYMYDDRWSLPGHPGLDYVDWQDQLFRKGYFSSYQLSARGGTDIVNYYVSGDYLNQDGIAIGVNNERFTARANIEIRPSDQVKFGLNLSPSYSIVSDPGIEGKDQIMQIAASMAPVVESDVGAENTNVGPNNRYAWAGSRVSPVAMARERERKRRRLRNLASIYFEYEFMKGVRYRGSANTDIQTTTLTDFSPSIIDRNRVASGRKEGNTRRTFVTEHTLTYNKSFKNHQLNVLGGYSYNFFNYDNYSIRGRNYASDEVPTVNAAGEITSATGTESQNSLISYFSRVQYNFDEKYFLEGSLRRDGSSRFGNDTKWGVFPSLAAGWRISEENFLKDNSTISELKFRGSWGRTGNNNIGNYESIANLSATDYNFGGVIAPGQSPAGIANPNLSWETAETINLGLNLGLLNNRIVTSFEYYISKNKDLLLNIPVPSSTGFTNALVNIGEVENKGWEFDITSRNLDTGDFSWTTSINLSHNENEVTALGPNNTPIYGGRHDITHNVIEVGYPIRTLWLVQQDGLLTTADIESGYPNLGGRQVAGDPKYVDQDGDGDIDADDRTYSGDPNPDYLWGITNRFEYKGFDLTVFLQGQTGGHIYSTFGRGIYRTGMGGIENTLGRARNRYVWQDGAVVTEADVAGKERKSPSSFGRIKNTDWLYSSDYWRIRNITLGYDLGSQIQSNLFSGIRLYFTLENWFGNDKYDGGWNPEAVNDGGDDYGAFPISRSAIFGINFNF